MALPHPTPQQYTNATLTFVRCNLEVAITAVRVHANVRCVCEWCVLRCWVVRLSLPMPAHALQVCRNITHLGDCSKKPPPTTTPIMSMWKARHAHTTRHGYIAIQPEILRRSEAMLPSAGWKWAGATSAALWSAARVQH